MPDTRKLKDLSRQELYDLIWSTPIDKVAADFGVAEATVKNHSNNRNIPRPTPRYWRAIAAGGNPRKKPLPPSAKETFEVQAQKPLLKSLVPPAAGAPLHPLATEMLKVILKSEPWSHQLIRLNEIQFPEVHVTKAMAPRAAQAFHVILSTLEPLGIEFRKFPGKHNSGYFRWGHDRMFVEIQETLLDEKREERTDYWWKCQGQFTPSGHLAFICNPNTWGRTEEKIFQESSSHVLPRVLSEVVSHIRLQFLTMQRKHIQDAIDRKKWAEEYDRRCREHAAAEVIRIQKEKEQAHVDAIQAVVEARKLDLLKAAEWWRRSQSFSAFLAECERRWKEPAGELNPEQQAWLSWAKEISANMSPFAVGYPDPIKHGGFDAATIPFGGPYPAAQNFPQPT